MDNDVFFAAIYSAHQHHKIARVWLDKEKSIGWAITTETWLAAMRLLMNPAIMKNASLKGKDAWNVVSTECGGKTPAKIIYAKKTPDKAIFNKAVGHRQVMDFWLVQLAKQEKCKLVTFDKALKSHWPDDVLLVKAK